LIDKFGIEYLNNIFSHQQFILFDLV
jgi:hypothetical protein